MNNNKIIKDTINEMDLNRMETTIDPKAEKTNTDKVAMFKRPSFLAAMAVLICFLAGGIVTAVFLGNRPIQAEAPSEKASMYAPTGEAHGIGRTCLFYDGEQYYNHEWVSRLPKDTYEVGEVVARDDYTVPTENFTAAHLPIGASIYASTTDHKLYVAKSDYFVIMVRADEE